LVCLFNLTLKIPSVFQIVSERIERQSNLNKIATLPKNTLTMGNNEAL